MLDLSSLPFYAFSHRGVPVRVTPSKDVHDADIIKVSHADKVLYFQVWEVKDLHTGLCTFLNTSKGEGLTGHDVRILSGGKWRPVPLGFWQGR